MADKVSDGEAAVNDMDRPGSDGLLMKVILAVPPAAADWTCMKMNVNERLFLFHLYSFVVETS